MMTSIFGGKRDTLSPKNTDTSEKQKIIQAKPEGVDVGGLGEGRLFLNIS